MRIAIILSEAEGNARNAVLEATPDAMTDEKYVDLADAIWRKLPPVDGERLKAVDLYCGGTYLYTLVGDPR